jgi:fructose-specific phosphotransferase system IIC component
MNFMIGLMGFVIGLIMIVVLLEPINAVISLFNFGGFNSIIVMMSSSMIMILLIAGIYKFYADTTNKQEGF